MHKHHAQWHFTADEVLSVEFRTVAKKKRELKVHMESLLEETQFATDCFKREMNTFKGIGDFFFYQIPFRNCMSIIKQK